jgi:hypothetical protein
MVAFVGVFEYHAANKTCTYVKIFDHEQGKAPFLVQDRVKRCDRGHALVRVFVRTVIPRCTTNIRVIDYLYQMCVLKIEQVVEPRIS